MNISIIGTGYVGLVTGTCFAEMGHNVVCVDIDADKINKLKQGILPIYEPGLEELVKKNSKENRLSFTTSIEQAAGVSSIHFIAVGTPPDADSAADLRFVLEVARQLGQCLELDYNVIVDKSTVPVGTADRVRATIEQELDKRKRDIAFDVVSNPEFLKEGAAIDDFMKPDRVVIGTDNEKSRKIMHELYKPFMRNHELILSMGIRDAEMTKYVSNAMLATKISFMNEVAELCEKLDVDVEQVRHGIGSDKRIGYDFIYPGCGYGGSCFPKDVKALERMAIDNDVPFDVLHAVESRNRRQKERLFAKVASRFGHDLKEKTFCLWGLAFKPGTDDMREAPSLQLISDLVRAGATINVYDPVATETAKAAFALHDIATDNIRFFKNQYDALDQADALIIATEWKQFRNPDFETIKQKLNEAIVFDGRNIYDPETMARHGFSYTGIGRGNH